MVSSMDRVRNWQGPAVFSYGFRPFFLGAGLWAAVSMVLWVPLLSGHIDIPTAFDPVSWHAHEFLFGYLGAVLAGFLLTAVPNWTGRLPMVGWPLVGLFVLWAVGRLAVLYGSLLSPGVVAAADLAMPVALIVAIAREIVIGKNWRNLIVLAMATALAVGNALFHWEAATGAFAAQGMGLRLGLAAGVMMIAVVGGRIVPSFTRNWLVKRAAASLPAPPMGRFDRVALVALLAALVAWVGIPESAVSGALLAIAGVLHFVRLVRWKGGSTAAEPLVLILHIGYAFVPLGAVAMAVAVLTPDGLYVADAQHLWMAGGIGIMTVAVMTRATLGHTGQALTAGKGTLLVYGLIILSVMLRFCAGSLPFDGTMLYSLSGLSWILGYVGFVLFYGPKLLRRAK
ncbi:NnrS family protein [Rhodospirillaceae bacterium KN72]|uniref:NnrS family protein n=1 Tax=Pacificispira spongiicola TaxID=2729598 RepID=A0A7Y0DX63_9PROT|nr:NnrS family protein [Pacificispira spongiicola]NMM43098.1 NnrS family protein [Pacificispira spongiicola]